VVEFHFSDVPVLHPISNGVDGGIRGESSAKENPACFSMPLRLNLINVLIKNSTPEFSPRRN